MENESPLHTAVEEWIHEIDRFAYRLGNDPASLGESFLDEVSQTTSSIQRVPAYMGARMELKNFYVPKLISFGPIHLGKPYVPKLIALEMCPDFRNNYEISSHLVFLSSLIDQPEDVKELRLAGILQNELASDKQVADLFNHMDFLLVPETFEFAYIRDQIEEHLESRRGKIRVLGWIAEAYNNYFRSPWTIIALLAATLALVLTLIQTWYAIHPKGG